MNIRYRVNDQSLLGKPDISIKKYKIVVFIDGEFWHGYNWKEKREKIKSNRDYWVAKIERNMQRDVEVDSYYSNEGWVLFRFWQKEIVKELDVCISKIVKCINSQKL